MNRIPMQVVRETQSSPPFAQITPNFCFPLSSHLSDRCAPGELLISLKALSHRAVKRRL